MNDAEYLIDEYDSDDDRQGDMKPEGSNNGYNNVSKEVLDLLKRYCGSWAFRKRVIVVELVLISLFHFPG